MTDRQRHVLQGVAIGCYLVTTLVGIIESKYELVIIGGVCMLALLRYWERE